MHFFAYDETQNDLSPHRDQPRAPAARAGIRTVGEAHGPAACRRRVLRKDRLLECLSGRRDPDEVLRTDVQAPGVALLHLMRVSVDRERRVVRAGLLGFIGNGLAVARPNTGCAAVPDGNLEFAMHVAAPGADSTVDAPKALAGGAAAVPVSSPVSDAAAADVGVGVGADSGSPQVTGGAPAGAAAETLWPDGNRVATNPAFVRVLADDTLAGPGMRAIVVVDQGAAVAAEKLFKPLGMTTRDLRDR